MSTSFDLIYAQVENRSTDADLSNYGNLYYYQMFETLKYCISEFKKHCVKNLGNRTNFSQEIYQFTGDGVTKDYSLSPVPVDNSNFYVTINNTLSTAYTYSYVTNILSFTTAPDNLLDIYIGTYIIGEFTETLADEEISILAEGFKVNLTSKSIFTTKQLNQMIYGNSVGLHSQANHNKATMIMDDIIYKRWKQRMMNYTYENDPDDLSGTVGDLYP